MSRLLIPLGWIIFICSACSQLEEPQRQVRDIETSIETIAFAKSVEGTWYLNSVSSGDCPQELGDSPLRGLTKWQRDQDLITISSPKLHLPVVTLQARTDSYLGRQTNLIWRDCELYEDLELLFDVTDSKQFYGTYSAIYSHDGSPACQALEEDFGFSSSCEVRVEWQAHRIPGH